MWTGAFLSSLGTWTQDVALGWVIHTRMGNPLYLGLRAFAADAPLLAFMLLGGAVADRIDRRRILLTSQVLQMAFAATLAVLFALDRLGIGAILLLAALTGLAQSQSAPTYQAVITTLVPARYIPNAVALNSLQFNLSRAIGPAIAGLLLTHGGTTWCFVANAASFLAVIVALWRVEIATPVAVAGESLLQSVRDGFGHVRSSSLLLALVSLGAAGSLLAFPLITYLPVIADDVLGAGAAGYSLLVSSFGAGAIVGALRTAHRGQVPRRGRLAMFAFVSYGVSCLGAVLSTHHGVAVAFLFAAGWSLVTAFSTLNSLVQENAPDALRGRIVSIYGLAFRGGAPLGNLAAGVLVRWFGAPAAIGGFALTLALVAVGVYLRSASVRSV